MAVNASVNRAFVVSSMRVIASDVCAIESTRSRRCVVRNTCRAFELVELLDGHHVHRPEPIDLRLQSGDGFLGGHRRRRIDSRQPAPRTRPARHLKRQCSPRRPPGRAPRRRSRPRPASPDRLLHLSTSASTSSSDVLHGVDARLREVRQVAFGRRPRDLELARLAADLFERATRLRE